MNEAEINEIIKKIEREMTGDPEKDLEIWNEGGERYRGQPGSEPLLHEIGRRMFDIAMKEDGDLAQEIFDDMVETADDDYDEACSLIDRGKYDDALGKLLVLTALIRAYPLPEETIWMDFASYLDSLVYMDYYSEEIGDREIGRHPMHPGRMLYTCGSLLIEMNRAEEALEPLEMLVSLDPVCPKYLFELGEAYKRLGRLQDAYDNARYALQCASNRVELARGYRDLAYCLTEAEEYEDAVMLYLMSLQFQSSRSAEAELQWIRKKTGINAEDYTEEMIKECCQKLDLPVEISEVVQKNIELLDILSSSSDDQE